VKLARINTLLLVAIILINGYIVVLPVIPGMLFWLEKRDGTRQSQLEKNIRTPLPDTAGETKSNREHRLTIPSMLLDESVHKGPDARTLRQGLWHRPTTSTPDKESNTVIVGHRLTYTDPKGTLYNLGKVRVGDDIGLTWGGKKYLYRVTHTKVVASSAIEIEASTSKPRLTIYTCTPLWLPKDRLVVIAELQEIL
jgi:LPXTG-site transpeptidase (sortase) family protein